MAAFGPDIETAADTTISADCLGAANTGFPHFRFDLRDLQNRSVTQFGLNALHNVDHPIQRALWNRGHITRFADHRLFHESVARTDRDAMTARDAARLANRLSPVPQDPRIGIFPANRQRFVDLQILTCFYAAPAKNALVRVLTIYWIRLLSLAVFVPD